MPESGVVTANGIQIAYETFGSRGDPPILLVMGLGTQMLAWPDELCQQLADGGHFVVRFDNRDVGLSTHLSDVPAPSTRDLLLRRRAPYTLEDMAEDAVGLLDALGIPSADVVGASLGGFIAQLLAIRHPARVRTLTLVMTSNGSVRVGRARPRLLLRLLRLDRPADRQAAIEAGVATSRLISAPGYGADEDRVRELAGRSYDRSHDLDGYRRQLAASAVQRDRTRELRELVVPTLVIHGLDDPLVSVTGGLALARTIPGSRFVGYWGMGHNLPQPLWGEVAREILALSQAARAGEVARPTPAAAAASASASRRGPRRRWRARSRAART